MEEESI